MTPAVAGLATANESKTAPIQAHLDRTIEDLLLSLPKPGELSAEQRRGIIARYTAVLEGNFIYWMTGAYIAVASDEPAPRSWTTCAKRCATAIPG